jgi:molybdate transport system ATP-binding protein
MGDVREPDRKPRTSGLNAHVVGQRGALELDLCANASPGEVVGVLGPNGAGKTSLLQALAGLLPLDAGHVILDGAVLDEPAARRFVPAEDRSIGLVFQDYLLFPHLSVLDNVAFAHRAGGQSKALARQRARALLERLELIELADQRPGTLSGGQAQRVALARALAREPDLLLLDEPLAALDVASRAEVRAGLRTHLSGFGGCSLVVVHDALDAAVLADRLLVVEEGRVVQAGSTREVMSRPQSAFAARLFGINLLRGHARGRAFTPDDGGILQLGDEGSDGRVLIALRPDAVALSNIEPSDATNRWPGIVRELEQHDRRVQVTVDAAPPVRVEVDAAGLGELGLSKGTEVWLSASPDDLVGYPELAPGAAEVEQTGFESPAPRSQRRDRKRMGRFR